MYLAAISASVGSPPHTWGTRVRVLRGPAAHRFTPTYVGNTLRCLSWAAPPAVHPHIRGEHPNCSLLTSPPPGSPPHTWGTHQHGRWLGESRAVHPHIRGEHGLAECLDARQFGSPPHTWGTPRRGTGTGSSRAVHPHIRGEHRVADLSNPLARGSPPHTWGTLVRVDARGQGVRFTPTYVGNTTPCTARTPSFCGSPPHTWGTRSAQRCRVTGYRFTPTYVGNTDAPLLCRRRAAVHPHIRGEHRVEEVPSAVSPGSPPHTWGTRQPLRCLVGNARFTPTYVGNTGPISWRTYPPAVHPHIRGEH